VASVPISIRPFRYAGNPTITLPVGTWYSSQIYDFNVLVDPTDSTKLMMFCSGMAAPVAVGTQSIGLFRANVSDPYTWTEVGQVITPTESWENGLCRLGSVIYDSGTFYLFYSGDATGEKIGVATSTDNGATFTKYASNPILTPTGQGRNDGDYVSEPAVIKEGSAWTMIYSYRNGATILPGFRYATSSDGFAWTKGGSGDVLTTAPLYGEFHQILKKDGLYYLVYEAGSTTVPYRIFMATSSVVTGPFVTTQASPILLESGVVGSFDRYHVATPCLAEISGRWLLFYSGAGDHDQPYGTNHWPGGMAEFAARPCGYSSRNLAL